MCLVLDSENKWFKNPYHVKHAFAVPSFENFINSFVRNFNNSYTNKIFDVLFQIYLNDLEKDKNETSITKFYIKSMNQEYLDKTSKPKIVCDYIAGMTDDFFNREFRDAMIPSSFGYKVEKNRS